MTGPVKAAALATSKGEPRLLVRGQADLGALTARLVETTAGRFSAPVATENRLLLHLGAPTRLTTRCGPVVRPHVAIRGDITVIPAGAETLWIDEEPSSTMSVAFSEPLLLEAAGGLRTKAPGVEFAPQVQQQDAHLFHLCRLLADLVERGETKESVYTDSLSLAIAARTILRFGQLKQLPTAAALPPRRLKTTLSYIEDHIEEDLRLTSLANVAGLSTSHFRLLFRGSMGKSVHQYIIERRVERARLLISSRRASIAQAAQQTGFCHQSHLARRMRQVLGVTPSQLLE